MTFITDFGTASPGDTVSIQLFPAARHEGIVGRDGYKGVFLIQKKR